MKVFLSWSGPRSKAVAELLNDWIKCVLQAAKPWISTRDIDRGSVWYAEIGKQLSETAIGIICLTNNNKNNPWILFEAGGLAKGLAHSKVCTLLIDLNPSDVEDPLAQFNHTLPNKEGLLSLVVTLNNCMDQGRLDEKTLTRAFETYWPQFESDFKAALTNHKPSKEAPKRSEQSLLEEILSQVRNQNSKIRDLEDRLSSKAAAELSTIPALSSPITLGFDPEVIKRLRASITPFNIEEAAKNLNKNNPNKPT